MARVTAEKVLETKEGLLEAARQVLHSRGFAGLSTREVAREAGVPMSQIQYHFGSKDGLVLALFAHMNAQLLERQTAMFADPELTLSQKWDLACDYLDEDLGSGYVRVLQELFAAGWSNPEIGRVVRDGMMGWLGLLTEMAGTARDEQGSTGPFTPDEIAALVGSAFIGAESYLLLGIEDEGVPIRRALRRFGDLIRAWETQDGQGSE
jgi:AcrR family transcriptional regulator